MTRTDPICVACIVGARSNFMKKAPILKVFQDHGGFAPRLLEVGHFGWAWRTRSMYPADSDGEEVKNEGNRR